MADLARAADFLEQYADFIKREVMSVDIERHPYLPELEEVAADVRAAAEADARTPVFVTNPAEGAVCGCEACMPPDINKPETLRMILCAKCGNKRCPHATDHRNACTGSNEPGQRGSSWEHVPPIRARQPRGEGKR